RSVFVGLVLFAVLPLNDAACWRGKLKQGATHCQDGVDKTWHAIGSSWTNSRCDQCECKNDLLSCCHGLPTSVHTTEDCVVEYDYEKCTFDVFKRSDGSRSCAHSAVGK
ncbi:hypothetical protein NFI96_015146, partial [Prochilodus magdalenae]